MWTLNRGERTLDCPPSAGSADIFLFKIWVIEGGWVVEWRGVWNFQVGDPVFRRYE